MIDDITPVNTYSGNGSTTTFDFDFLINAESELVVLHTATDGTQTTLTLNVDYTINAVGNNNGSYITFPIAGSTYSTLQTGEKISLVLDIPVAQTFPFGTSSVLNLNSLEKALDYIVRLIQIEKRRTERSVKVPEGSDVDTDELTQDLIIVTDNIASVNAVSGDIANIDSVAADLTNINAVYADLTNIDNVAADLTNINAVYADLTNIDTVSTSISNINFVAADLTNINAVYADLTNIDTVSTSISNINSVAADLTNINSVAGDLTNIDTVKDNLTGINAVATDITNVNSVAADLTNIDAVKNNSANINAVKNGLLDIAAVAGAITNVNAVGNNISDVNLVADNIPAITDFSLAVDLVNNGKALETGGVSDNATVYNQVRDYYHSTYDSTKFTVTGSPTITADGIASGFTSSAYISIPVQSTATTSYREEIEFSVPATIASTQVIKGTKTDNNGFRIMINTDKEIRLSLADTNSSNTWNVLSNTLLYRAAASATYKVVLYWNGTKYTVSVYDENNNVLGTPVTANSNYPPKNAQIQIGNCSQWSYGRPFGGEINLKNYNVDVDGVNVFNGNQSGTDTYKVAGSGTTINYTAVGTPTITSNVVSDFTADDYVTSDVNFNPGSFSFEIGTKITMPAYNSPILNIPAGGGSFYWLEFDSNTSNLHFDFGGSNYGEIENVAYPSEGQPLWIKLAYDGTNFVLSMSTDGTTYSDSVTVTANNFVAPNAPINFGVADLMTTFFYGSIDMSQTYFKVNGSVVWQGVTTISDIIIPYNLSNTGSKIATAASRNDIAALYAQNGYAPYYTIDEVNKTFTLPAGEIYGMLGRLQRLADNEIGLPTVTLCGTLNDGEIWLEGAEVSKTTYSKLYAIYGDDYGTPLDNDNFVLPNFTDRVMQGIDSTGTWGYIAAGLPNITGQIVNAYWDDSYTTGAFAGTGDLGSAGGSDNRRKTSFDASRSNSIYGNANTVQPPAIKVRVKTRYA